MAAGSGAYASKRRSGKLRFWLFCMLIFFGGGFYSGVYATKRVISSNSGILHRAFGIQPPAPPAAPAPAVPPTPAAAPAAPTPAATPPAPASTPPAKPASVTKPAEPSAPASTNADNSQASASTDTEQSTPPAEHKQAESGTGSGEDQSLLAKQVEDYNDMLHRIQDALRHYSVIHQKELDSKTKAADLKQLTQQEDHLCNEISQAAKHAENLQDSIRANSSYAQLYMEGSNCAARKDVPTKLLDLDLDKLKFIDKAP